MGAGQARGTAQEGDTLLPKDGNREGLPWQTDLAGSTQEMIILSRNRIQKLFENLENQ
jgi:hypothetical protein